MAKMFQTKSVHEPTQKGTSIGRKPITSTMNKARRRSFKKYRGQGKWIQKQSVDFVKFYKGEKQMSITNSIWVSIQASRLAQQGKWREAEAMMNSLREDK